MTRRAVETDVCIVGSGISAAMVAERLARTTTAKILVVEAGDDTVPLGQRARGARAISPLQRESVGTRSPRGVRGRRTAAIALDAGRRTGDALGRRDAALFAGRLQAEVALRRRHRLADHLRGARPVLPGSGRAHGHRGRAGAGRPRSARQTVPAAGDSADVQPRAAQEVGVERRHRDVESAVGEELDSVSRTAAVLPQRHLLADLPDRRQVLAGFHVERASQRESSHADDAHARPKAGARSSDGATVSHAIAVNSDRPNEPVELHAKLFVVAAGYTWSSHLLLLSAQDKAPNGVANGSGLVGKYLAGHRNVQAIVELPLRLYPGMNEQHSLVTKQFMRLKAGSEYIRHDLRDLGIVAGQDAASRRRQRRAHARRRDSRRLAPTRRRRARRASARTTT